MVADVARAMLEWWRAETTMLYVGMQEVKRVRKDEFACLSAVDLGPSVADKALCPTRHDEVTTTSYLARIDIPGASLPSSKMAEPGLRQIRHQKKRALPWRLPLLAVSTRPEIPMTVFLWVHSASPHST